MFHILPSHLCRQTTAAKAAAAASERLGASSSVTDLVKNPQQLLGFEMFLIGSRIYVVM